MAEQATHGFTRRSFIKGAAALTATGALVGCSPQTQNLEKAEPQKGAPETQIFSGACRSQCGQGCYLDVHVRDGQVVRTTAGHFEDGPEFDRICPKGLSQPARVYSSERLQYPMRRVGERGAGEFERITWDEAISEITDKWKQYIDEFGPLRSSWVVATPPNLAEEPRKAPSWRVCSMSWGRAVFCRTAISPRPCLGPTCSAPARPETVLRTFPTLTIM